MVSRLLLGLMLLVTTDQYAGAEYPTGEVGAFAVSVGITPEVLTAAGLAGHAAGILEVVRDASDLRSTLSSQRAAADEASESVRNAARAVAANPDDPLVWDAFNAMKELASSAINEVEITEAALRDHALAICTISERDSFEMFLTATGYQVPTEFGGTERTPDQWRDLESALIAEQRAAATGSSIAGSAEAQLLLEVRAEPAVVAALQRLQSQLTGVTSIFELFE